METTKEYPADLESFFKKLMMPDEQTYTDEELNCAVVFMNEHNQSCIENSGAFVGPIYVKSRKEKFLDFIENIGWTFKWLIFVTTGYKKGAK